MDNSKGFTAVGQEITHYTVCILCHKQVEACTCRLPMAHFAEQSPCAACQTAMEV